MWKIFLLILLFAFARFHRPSRDYSIRKQMLVQRLAITVDSMLHAKRVRQQPNDELAALRALIGAQQAAISSSGSGSSASGSGASASGSVSGSGASGRVWLSPSAVFCATPSLLAARKVTDRVAATPVRKACLCGISPLESRVVVSLRGCE